MVVNSKEVFSAERRDDRRFPYDWSDRDLLTFIGQEFTEKYKKRLTEHNIKDFPHFRQCPLHTTNLGIVEWGMEVGAVSRHKEGDGLYPKKRYYWRVGYDNYNAFNDKLRAIECLKDRKWQRDKRDKKLAKDLA